MSNVATFQKAPEPELILRLECSEAPVTIRSIGIVCHYDEWGDDKQKAVKLKMEFDCADPQIVPDEYADAVREIQDVALRGPDDKSNAVRMSIRHEVKRGTYRLRFGTKGAQIDFSGEPKSPSLVIDNKRVALKWRTECIIPAGRLLDLA